MAKRERTARVKNRGKRPATIKPEVAAVKDKGLAGLAGFPSSFEGEVGRLGDGRFHTAQRQALAAHIGREQGNFTLQRVLSSAHMRKQDDQARDRFEPDLGARVRSGVTGDKLSTQQFGSRGIRPQGGRVQTKTESTWVQRQPPAKPAPVTIPMPTSTRARGKVKTVTPSTYSPTDFRQDLQLSILSAIDNHKTALWSFKNTLDKATSKGLKILMEKSLTFALGQIPVYGGAIAFSYDVLNSLYADNKSVSKGVRAAAFVQAVLDNIADAKKKAIGEAVRIGRICEIRLQGYASKPDEVDKLKNSMHQQAIEVRKKIPNPFAIEKALYESWVSSKKSTFFSAAGKLQIVYRSTDPIANRTFKLESAKFQDVGGASSMDERMKKLMGGNIDLGKIKTRKLVTWRGWQPLTIGSVWLDENNRPSKPFQLGLHFWNQELHGKLPTVNKLGDY